MRRQLVVALLILGICHLTRGQYDIQVPPAIIKDPSRSIIFRTEDSVTLECEASGIPSVMYEWKKNGFVLNLNQQNIRRQLDGTITISPATAIDEGYYQCFATNQLGRAVSTTAHLQRAVLEASFGVPSILTKTVQEGQPFHIQADQRRSFPRPTYFWQAALNAVDRNPVSLRTSKRIQIAEDGDLYFAYAIPQDALSGRLYKFTTYNPFLDIAAGGGYTNLTVETGNVSHFGPTLAFASVPVVAVLGRNVSLRCFFSGYPEPTVYWTGPGNTLPLGWYSLSNFNTELVIRSIARRDEGDYVCTASNTRGRTEHRIQVRVEAAPVFRNRGDGPQNVNVSEGDSYTFKCNAEAIPEAQVVWYLNGVPVDVNNPPKKFVFSANNKSLTIRNVCRDCNDTERPSDLTVIQCNASNIHGYAFGSAYLNVLKRTRISSPDQTNVTVESNDYGELKFECTTTSDPSTPLTVRWFKVERGERIVSVYEEPPELIINGTALTIRVHSNSAVKWNRYKGEYKCLANNGYTEAVKTVKITVKETVKTTVTPVTAAEETGCKNVRRLLRDLLDTFFQEYQRYRIREGRTRERNRRSFGQFDDGEEA